MPGNEFVQPSRSRPYVAEIRQQRRQHTGLFSRKVHGDVFSSPERSGQATTMQITCRRARLLEPAFPNSLSNTQTTGS
jgi:hypothetical protein